jgi:hypothetical protein
MKTLAALSVAAASTTVAARARPHRREYQLTNGGLTIGRVTESYVRKGDTTRS